MATNYPANVDNGTTLPNPTGVNTQNNPDHASLHSNANDAIKGLEAKVGTGASTPVVNTFLFGTGTGTSAWTTATSAQIAAAVSDETGTGSLVFATTPTLVTPKVDTINEATLNNGTTIGGVNIKGGFMSGANITAGTVGNTQLATGAVVQEVDVLFTAVATGTTLIPWDDTIPQNTEGDQYMTLAITPKAATNKLFIEINAVITNSVANNNTVALFQDTTANALAAGFFNSSLATGGAQIPVYHSLTAGTTSTTTFKVRIGGSLAGTITFNGSAGGRKYGGITVSTMRITEYKI